MLTVAAGCMHQGRQLGGGGDDPFGGPAGSRPSQLRIEVNNMNFADARLYVIRNAGTRVSLGNVGGNQQESFTIEWLMVQDLRIEINLLAGPTCTTERIVAEPGDIIELQIQSVFSQSAFCR